MGELFDKEVNTQIEFEKITSGVHGSSCKPMKKCVMKMKETKKKRRACKNVIDGRRKFIGCVWQSSVIDSKEAQADTLNVLHNYLFSKQINRCQGDGFLSVST